MGYAMGGAMVVNHGVDAALHGSICLVEYPMEYPIARGMAYPMGQIIHGILNGIPAESRMSPPVREALHYDASYVIFKPSNEFAPRIAPWGMPWSVPWVLG